MFTSLRDVPRVRRDVAHAKKLDDAAGHERSGREKTIESSLASSDIARHVSPSVRLPVGGLRGDLRGHAGIGFAGYKIDDESRPGAFARLLSECRTRTILCAGWEGRV